MKNIVMPIPIEIGTVKLPEETKNQLKLKTQDEKKIAGDPKSNESPATFTAVDMWNCQRQSRSASSMMRWNLN